MRVSSTSGSMFKKVAIESRELKRKRKYKGKTKIKGQVVTQTKGTEGLFKKLPMAMRYGVLKQAVRAGGQVVAKAAKEAARPHSSKQTGTRKKWSQKIKNQRANNPMPLWKTPATKVKVYKNAVLAMTGPRRPWGNIANIFEYGGTINLWGPSEDNPNPQTYRLPPHKFLRFAADTTKGLQRHAFIDQVKKRWRKL